MGRFEGRKGTKGGDPRGTPVPERPSFPELLAPAGSPEAYFAAVSAGADAVYLGLQKFNARERAENFTLDDLCRVLPHARRKGVRVHLAMNILLREDELPEAIGLLHQVAPLSPDAVIVQDLGLLRIVREHFPSLPVHVSTQAGCASVLAARQFGRLGAQRVILERHLRLPEVRRILDRSPVGVEIFVHGAMCYSFSGRCLFSSFLGGKSANRGACVQPCRRVYAHDGGEEAVFSTRDLSLMELLPDLVPLGISALKIEGRMRSAEYVAGVVSAYRTALDLIRAGRPEDGVRAGRARLAEVIGREETAGLTGGARADEVVAGGATGNVGDLLGQVRDVAGGWAFVPSGAPVAQGDRLRVQFQADGSGKGFSALAMRAGPGGFHVKVPFPVQAGDLLFRVGGPGRAEFTRQARREMERIAPAGVRFLVAVGAGVVAVEATYGTVRREFAFRVAGGEAPPATGLPPDAAPRLRAVYRGDLPLGEIRVEGSGGRVAWVDVESLFLKAARTFDRDFYLEGKEKRLSILPGLKVRGARPEGLPSLVFAGCTANQLPALPKSPGIVPVVEFTRSLARDPSALGARFRDHGFLRLPPPLLEGDAAFLARTVRDAVRKGFRQWVVSDIGHFPLVRELRADGVRIITDHSLYAFNTGALSVLSRLGAERMVLPAEASIQAIGAVAKYLYGLGIAVAYGAIPLMISRLVPSGGVRRGEVVSPRAERFAVEADERGSSVRPVRPFSAAGFLKELRAAGIRDFYADLHGLSPDRVRAVLDALSADREIEGTTTFNLFRGNA